MVSLFQRFALSACCLILIPHASAQVLYGSIVGAVTDASSAAIPGATVAIHQRETGQSRQTVTNQTGGFQFSTCPRALTTSRSPRPVFKK